MPPRIASLRADRAHPVSIDEIATIVGEAVEGEGAITVTAPAPEDPRCHALKGQIRASVAAAKRHYVGDPQGQPRRLRNVRQCGTTGHALKGSPRG
jgi:hypothetical protein